MRLDDELVIAQGLRDSLDTYDTLNERVKATRECARALARLGLREAARAVTQTIDESECVDRAVCPACGEDIASRRVPEAHPYGATVAVEHRYVAHCPECGWEADL